MVETEDGDITVRKKGQPTRETQVCRKVEPGVQSGFDFSQGYEEKFFTGLRSNKDIYRQEKIAR